MASLELLVQTLELPSAFISDMEEPNDIFFFCKAQAMIAERKIRLCKLLSSESETIEIKTLQHHCVNLWRIGEAF